MDCLNGRGHVATALQALGLSQKRLQRRPGQLSPEVTMRAHRGCFGPKTGLTAEAAALQPPGLP